MMTTHNLHTIVFENRKDSKQSISVTVDRLYLAKSFHELFMNDNLNSKAVEKLQNEIENFYTNDQQNKYGVVGIEFTLKPTQF